MQKTIAIALLIFLHNICIGQTSSIDLNVEESKIVVPRFIAKNPVTLVNYLTKDKNTEKEKFDVIFTWVATNIRYNYQSYYSSSGASISKINYLLKHRTGICIDYAFLMDSLCKLAGLTNVSVYGYAKDEIFDVGDSLYVDNHAWNAVKLDNLWYVYDVTWASGQTEYKLNKLSNYLYNILLKTPPKYKTKQSERFKFVFTNYCDSAQPKTLVKSVYYKQKFFNKIVRNFLLHYKYKTKRYLYQKLNKEYYLCNPDTFAITHYPDDPRWSLTPTKTLRQVECDSTYYHLSDSTFKTQVRVGRPNPAGDTYLSYDELNKQKIFRKESLTFNKRNSFAPMDCEYNISKLIFKDCLEVLDSLTKVTIIDTALSYLDLAKGSLFRSFGNIEQDYYLQRMKNSKKMDLLLDENKKAREFIYADKYNTSLGIKSLQDLKRNTKLMDRKLERRLDRVKKIETNDAPNPKLKNSDIKLYELNQKVRQLDSLINLTNDTIDKIKIRFEDFSAELLKRFKHKIIQHDSIFTPFSKTIRLRYSLFDNYKKKIILIKKDIELNTTKYLKKIDVEIYKPTEQFQLLGDKLYNTITYRNELEVNLFIVNAELIRRRQSVKISLPEQKTIIKNKNREDLCWIQNRITRFKSLTYALDLLINKQEAALDIVKSENRIEYFRFKYINKELARRKKKYKKIILHNYKVVNYQVRVERKEKRLFLKKLRTERRELAKQNRKK